LRQYITPNKKKSREKLKKFGFSTLFRKEFDSAEILFEKTEKKRKSFSYMEKKKRAYNLHA